MCLCGMLAAEVDTLPAPMPSLLQDYFQRNVEWVASVLSEGLMAGELALREKVSVAAYAIVSGLEGAMLLAKVRGGAVACRTSARILIPSICQSSEQISL